MATKQTPTGIFKGIVGSKRFRVVTVTVGATDPVLYTGGGRTMFATYGGPTLDTNMAVTRDSALETASDPGTTQGVIAANGVASTVNYCHVIGN